MSEAARTQNFLFGQYETDEKTWQRMRRALHGIHHASRTLPQKPEPDQAVTLQITVGPDFLPQPLYIVYTTEGDPVVDNTHGIKHGTMIEATFSHVEWETLVWGYIYHYQAILPPFPSGTRVSYIILSLSEREDRIYFAETSDPYANPTRFVYHLNHATTPAWADDAIFYHIFLDRFHPGKDKKFPKGLTLNDIWGGTLAGLQQSLPYLHNLGITALWLSPCYPSHSHHGYDLHDYRAINPRLGTLEEMKALVTEIHALDMRIILDFVPNHVSNAHPFFQDAINNAESTYRDWFYFREWPNKYESFFNLPTLPKLNTDHPDVRNYLIESAYFWLEEVGVDGFRMDHAHGASSSFWSDYLATIKKSHPNVLTIGEITEPSNFLKQYRGRLDGILDFIWLQEVRRFFIFDSIDAPTFEHFLRGHELFLPQTEQLLRFTFLDNHDMNRFLWSSQGDKQRLKLAALCQFTLSPPPIIYYGTEVGVTQERDVLQGDWAILEESRTAMRWGREQDKELLAFYRRLIHFRRTHPASYKGERIPLLATSQGLLAYARQYQGQTVLTVLNNSNQTDTIIISLKKLQEPPSLFRSFTGHKILAAEGQISLRLEAHEGTLLAGAL